MTPINLTIDDNTAAALLTDLLDASSGALGPAKIAVDGSALTRLEYPVLQALMALHQRCNRLATPLTFIQFEHLKEPLARYGVARSVFF